jgi:hypothetical protein
MITLADLRCLWNARRRRFLVVVVGGALALYALALALAATNPDGTPASGWPIVGVIIAAFAYCTTLMLVVDTPRPLPTIDQIRDNALAVLAQLYAAEVIDDAELDARYTKALSIDDADDVMDVVLLGIKGQWFKRGRDGLWEWYGVEESARLTRQEGLAA